MIELSQRKELIRHHPYFSPLNENDIEELAKFCLEKSFQPDQIVIKEGEIVDSVYLIARGDIEIDLSDGQKEKIPRCILRKGDAIGLTNEGFFSQTGLRTATLVSISEVSLIGWTIDVINNFIKKHPDFLNSRKEASETMLRMYFIKQAEPFSDLPPENIERLAHEIQEIHLDKGSILFQKGDEADKCYLICSGAVETYSAQKEGSEKIIANHHPWRLIGESVLHTTGKRYTCARMSESGKLLVLTRDQLHELMKHKNTAESIIALIIERCCPTQTPDIEHYHRKSDENQPITILKDKRHGHYYQLSDEGWFVWQHLDGHNNLQDITTLLHTERNIFAPNEIADLILNLADAGFVTLPDILMPQCEHPHEPPTKLQRFKEKVHQWRYCQYTFYSIEKAFSSSYYFGPHLFYTKIGKALMAVISLLGIICFGYLLHTFSAHTIYITHFILFFSALLMINFLSAVPHELAHGYTTKYYHRDVHRAGIIFYWLGITAFVDTSDMWLSDPRSRIIVSVAGPYMDFFIASILSILAYFITSPTASLFCWLLSLVLYYSVFKNLNPLQETDGYYITKEAFRDPHLRSNSIQWLKTFTLKTIFSNIKSHRNEFSYWLICLLFQVITVGLAFALAHYLRLYLPSSLLGISTSHLSWILPSVVILRFILIVKKLSK